MHDHFREQAMPLYSLVQTKLNDKIANVIKNLMKHQDKDKALLEF